MTLNLIHLTYNSDTDPEELEDTFTISGHRGDAMTD